MMKTSLGLLSIGLSGSVLLAPGAAAQEKLPPMRADAAREAAHYKIVDVFIPPQLHIEASSWLELPDGRIAIGTRRGDVFLVTGLEKTPPVPDYHLFASGLHEVFGLAWKDNTLYVTQQPEVTRLIDRNKDGKADRYETISDQWGYGGEHEFTFGSDFDKNGDIWVVLCLTGSYTSDNPFRGWCLRVSADGTTTPTCSGLRSPGGVGTNLEGVMFYTESQGPWNGACSLRELVPGGFMGHPIGNKWYSLAPNMGPRPAEPTGGREGRRHIDAKRIPQLVAPAVVFPYKKTCQSASAITCDRSRGKFGPFAGQLFIPDYTLSLVMRVDLEKVDGVYQGTCFPFREGFATGLIGAVLTKNGYLFVGGSSRGGWPTRGTKSFAIQRLEWTGVVPFEVRTVHVKKDGFELEFTKRVDAASAASVGSYGMTSYTHYYHRAYGSPEIETKTLAIRSATVLDGGKRVRLVVDGMRLGYVHELHMPGVRAASGETLLHDVCYYTLNRLPTR